RTPRPTPFPYPTLFRSRKVWGNRVFPILLAVLVAANLLLLWIGTRPTANQPPAAAYRAVGADLAALGSDMAAKGDFLHGKLDERSEEHTSELQSRFDLV